MTDPLTPARLQDLAEVAGLSENDKVPVAQGDNPLRSATLAQVLAFVQSQMADVFHDGEDGRSVQMRATSTGVQWRLDGSITWLDLFPFSAVQGEKGDRGEAFNVDAQGLFSARGAYNDEPADFSYLATDEGLIYFRQGVTGWSPGIPFGKGDQGIQGNPGIDGDDGYNVELRKSGTHIEWRYAGTGGSWTPLVALVDLKGPAGSDAAVTQANMTTALTDKEAFRTSLELGNAALATVGTGAGNVAAGDDSRITGAAQLVNLAMATGASLIGMVQSGVGGVLRTILAKLRENVTVADFGAAGGVATNDDADGFAKAIAELTSRGGGVLRVAPVNYYFNQIVVVPANVRIDLKGATVRRMTGSTLTHFFTISGDAAEVVNGRFIGTGMTAPGGAYSAGVYAGTAIFITGSCERPRVDNCYFNDFKSGPIVAYGGAPATVAGRNVIVSRCVFDTVQTYTGHQTNAVVDLYNCPDSQIIDCWARTYNWKCFYFANSLKPKIIRCDSNGGSTGLFDSSHHMVGCDDGLIADCNHEGTGAGFKLDYSPRSTVRRFNSKGAFAGIVQGCEDFLLESVHLANAPAAVGYGIAINGLAGYTSSGKIVNPRYVLSAASTSGSNVALSFQAIAGGTFGPIEVINPYSKNAYWGIYAANDGLAKALSVVNPQLIDCQQYGMIVYVGDLSVTGGHIRMQSSTAQSALYVARDGVTTTGDIIIDGTKFSGSTIRRNIEIGGGGRLAWRSLQLRNCSFVGGTRPLEFSHNANAADVVSVVIIENNTGTGFTTGGLSLTFNATTTTKSRVRNNDFTDASFAPALDTYTNLTNVVWLSELTYSGDPNGSFYAAPGTRCFNPAGGAGTSFRVKESAATLNTGWAAK